MYVGIDISKDRLDVCLLPCDHRLTLSNDSKGLDELIERLSAEVSPIIVMEATGGYEVPIAGAHYWRRALVRLFSTPSV